MALLERFRPSEVFPESLGKGQVRVVPALGRVTVNRLKNPLFAAVELVKGHFVWLCLVQWSLSKNGREKKEEKS